MLEGSEQERERGRETVRQIERESERMRGQMMMTDDEKRFTLIDGAEEHLVIPINGCSAS